METVVEAMSYDGLVTVVGCDKNMPGALMAMIRLNRPLENAVDLFLK